MSGSESQFMPPVARGFRVALTDGAEKSLAGTAKFGELISRLTIKQLLGCVFEVCSQLDVH